MPTQLRPNGIDDTIIEANPGGDPTVLAVATQTMPDSTQAGTLIEFWYSMSNAGEDDDLTVELECWSAMPVDDDDPILDAQIGDTLTVTVAKVGMGGLPATKTAKAMFLDRRPQQSTYYVVVGTVTAGAVNVWTNQSVALTTVGP